MAALWFLHVQGLFIYEPMAPLVVATEHCILLHLVIVGEEREMMEAQHMSTRTHTHFPAQKKKTLVEC